MSTEAVDRWQTTLSNREEKEVSLLSSLDRKLSKTLTILTVARNTSAAGMNVLREAITLLKDVTAVERDRARAQSKLTEVLKRGNPTRLIQAGKADVQMGSAETHTPCWWDRGAESAEVNTPWNEVLGRKDRKAKPPSMEVKKDTKPGKSVESNNVEIAKPRKRAPVRVGGASYEETLSRIRRGPELQDAENITAIRRKRVGDS